MDSMSLRKRRHLSNERASDISMTDTTALIEEVHDLLFVVDATASMQSYLSALQQALPNIISLSALTGCFARIGLLGYRDYCDSEWLDWSGWLDPAASADEKSQPDLLQKARDMHPEGGGDMPEALKTALARAYELARPKATTVVVLYTDAPPHLVFNQPKYVGWGNYQPEQEALKVGTSYHGHGPAFADWVSACKTLCAGPKRFLVFSFLPYLMRADLMGTFVYLTTLTNGATIKLKRLDEDHISKMTIDVLLAWMGVTKAGPPTQTVKSLFEPELVRYVDVTGINDARDEEDQAMTAFFRVSKVSRSEPLDQNMTRVEINHDILHKCLPKKKTPLIDFTKQWAASAAYRKMAIHHLERIFENDVQAMATNPVFGTLWRAVCNDRMNPQREVLTKQFAECIEKMVDPGGRQRMKTWLEESYDYGAEIAEVIDQMPADERFPCVFLDPTQTFDLVHDEDGSSKPVNEFTRAELLEISRSCDPRVLARLSKVLIRLTYVNTAEAMPNHIYAAPVEQVPRLPLALMQWKHGHKFWKYLLHLVVPGTLLSARPAAILAAMTLCVGLTPLLNSAEEEAMLYRDKWNNIEVPENWNTSCLSLLIDADDAYRARHPTESKTLLKPEDKTLFKQLVAFHILEMNLNMPLTARIGWTPDKSTAPIGPLLTCYDCKMPRSVTMMRDDGLCGLCAADDYNNSPELKQKFLATRVSRDQSKTSLATWVECSMIICRAQYVIYNVEDLRVRAKCYYCRQAGSLANDAKLMTAPAVECIKCRNRIIWPEQLRPKGFMSSDFICPACQSDQKTIVDAEIAPLEMQTADGMTWLALDNDNPTVFPFNTHHAQPVFKIATQYTTSNFLSRIKLLAPTSKPLMLEGKVIHDVPAVRSTLESWIAFRHVGKDACSMCFSTSLRSGSNLTDACGRKGCTQKACRECMEQWYGLNAAGRIINAAALSCPFCRRLAAGNRLQRYGHGVHAVGDLQRAVREQGQFIHAWCVACNRARVYTTRECARGMPAAVEHWRCEECVEAQRAEMLLEQRIREQVYESETDEDALRRIQGELDKVRRRPVRLCPSCGVATEKNGGCDHMECSACDRHWCWVCIEAIADDEVADHFIEMHGGFYAEYGRDVVDDFAFYVS